MDDGGYRCLADLRRRLDVAVARCYGWNDDQPLDPLELVRLLSHRNELIASGAKYLPFVQRTAKIGLYAEASVGI